MKRSPSRYYKGIGDVQFQSIADNRWRDSAWEIWTENLHESQLPRQ